jgi:ABC-type nickel/cobalt efflux system permease component RcnA/hydrogenase/urease accessory protein HupE
MVLSFGADDPKRDADRSSPENPVPIMTNPHSCHMPLLAQVLLIGIPSTAWAHAVNTDVGPFYAGMLHPLMSTEHLLPMLALALVASQVDKIAAIGAMALFPATLALGILWGGSLPSLDNALRLSNQAGLVILGCLLMFAARPSHTVVMIAVSLTGLILGFRSGIDWQASGVGYGFFPGLALTGAVVMALFAGGFPRSNDRFPRGARILCGLFFAAIGLAMLSGYWVTASGPMIRGAGLPTEADLTAMVMKAPLRPALVAGALFGAFLWGAGHALTPGHGKAIVGAYLIGARSTARHAVYLGLTVTITHTLGVFFLGLVALFAARFIQPEQLYPWLGTASGLIVLSLGAVMLYRRWTLFRRGRSFRDGAHTHPAYDHDHGRKHQDGQNHDHAGHDHSHTHHLPGDDGTPVTWRSLISLGISGGLLPCPAALVLLLAAVSIQRTGFGMVLVLAFSLGLAGVLTAVGLLFVRGRLLFGRLPAAAALGRYLPMASAIVILILGMILTGAALRQFLTI